MTSSPAADEFRILNIVDDVTRECLAAIPDTSISGRRVAREADCLDRAPRQTQHDRVRQRDRVHLERHARLGAGQLRSCGISLRQESRCRTASVRTSTAACATGFSTRACSSTLTMRDQGLRTGSADYNQRRPHSALGYLRAGGLRRINLSATCDRLRNPDQLSPIARCSICAPRRKTCRGSKRRWMKVQRQVWALCGLICLARRRGGWPVRP